MTKLLWTQRQHIGPTPRFGHAMVYDAARKQVLLFGGSGRDRLFGDTWVWDGNDWTQISDIGPAPRTGHAMAYDSARSRVVLFGGRTRERNAGDTWEWDGDFWTQVANNGPATRTEHSMAYHGTRKRVTLFGGLSSSDTPTADTWEWDGQDWTQFENVGPAARHGHTIVADATGKHVVLFGGKDTATGVYYRDTWVWDSVTWSQVVDFGPDHAAYCAMVSKKQRIALFGGAGVTEPGQPLTVFHLTWEWTGRHWTLRQDFGPEARMQHAMAFDQERSRVVLFGGLSGPLDAVPAPSIHGDTWEHVDESTSVIVPTEPNASWEFEVQPTSAPYTRNATAAFTVALDNRIQLVRLVATSAQAEGVLLMVSEVAIPAGNTSFHFSFPLLPIQQVLVQYQGRLPADVTLTATIDDVSKTSILKLLPG